MDICARCLLPLGLAAVMFAGCASQPLPDDPRSPPVVTRSADSTVWSTPEAVAAAAAAAEAAQRARAAARLAGAAGGGAAPAAAALTAKANTLAANATPARPGPSAAPVPSGSSSTPVSLVLPEAHSAPEASRLAFDFDSFDIKTEFSALLEGHARWLLANPGARWVVEGHADDRGGAEYNLALGQKRAQAVVKALLLLGVPEVQLEAVSFGDTRPLSEARDEAAWAQNRRAELRER